MSDCPSIYELTDSVYLPPQLAAHVSGCARCRALRAAWEAESISNDDLDLDDLPEAVWPHQVYFDQGAEPTPGAVHSIWGPESGELLVAVIVYADDEEALVIPISPDVQLAGDWDVLLDEPALPYPAVAQVWNHLHILREQCMEQLARLSSSLAAGLAQALDAFLTAARLSHQLRQGPALLTSDDPRHMFRDGEAARVREFTEPWRLLYAASTLGGVLRGRRDDCELALNDLSEELDLATEKLTRLEDDQEDLYSRVPVPDMERLVRRLSLPPSKRLANLVGVAVYENVRGTPALGLVRARRRRGVRSAAGPHPDDAARRAAAEAYVGRLMQRLGETT